MENSSQIQELTQKSLFYLYMIQLFFVSFTLGCVVIRKQYTNFKNGDI